MKNYSHNVPHGLSIDDRTQKARQRKLLTVESLPNRDGYQFTGVADDGWRFKCFIKRGDDEIHRIAGEACMSQLIGWLPLGVESLDDR